MISDRPPPQAIGGRFHSQPGRGHSQRRPGSRRGGRSGGRGPKKPQHAHEAQTVLPSNAISLEDLHAQIQLAMQHIQQIHSESAQFINDIQTKTNAVQQTLEFLSHQIGVTVCDGDRVAAAAAAGSNIITADDTSEHTTASTTEVATVAKFLHQDNSCSATDTFISSQHSFTVPADGFNESCVDSGEGNQAFEELIEVPRDNEQVMHYTVAFEPKHNERDTSGTSQVQTWNEAETSLAETYPTDDGGWVCQRCTLKNPKLSLVCAACEARVDGSFDDPLLINDNPTENFDSNVVTKDQTALEDVKLKQQEDKAKRKREKAERKKREKAEKIAADKARERDAEVERLQRESWLQAKRDKDALLAKHNVEVQQHADKLTKQAVVGKILPTEVVQTKIEDKQMGQKVTQPSEPSTKSTPVASSTAAPSIQREHKQVAVIDQLSFYIKKRPTSKTKGISPIFDLLQNKESVEIGRELMKLEACIYKCKKELRELELKKDNTAANVKSEGEMLKKRARAGNQEHTRLL